MEKSDDPKYKLLHALWKLIGEDRCPCFHCAIDDVMKHFGSQAQTRKWPRI